MSLDAIRKRITEGETSSDVLPLSVREAKLMPITVADLKEAIALDPEHLAAQSFKKGIRGYRDDELLHVETADLHALLEGREIQVDEFIENGERVFRKRLLPKKEAAKEEVKIAEDSREGSPNSPEKNPKKQPSRSKRAPKDNVTSTEQQQETESDEPQQEEGTQSVDPPEETRQN